MKKSRIIKSSSKLLIITFLIGNPLLRDTLTVFATESESIELPTNIGEIAENMEEGESSYTDETETSGLKDSSESEVPDIETEKVSEDIKPTEELFTEDTEQVNESSIEETTSDTAHQEAVASDDLASGTFGTSDWRIDSEGVLHIGAGEFGQQKNYISPWNDYAKIVNKIVFEGPVVGNVKSQALFTRLSLVTEIEGLNNFDISNATNIEYMFWGMSSLTSLDVSNFDTSNVTSMELLFAGTSNLTHLDVTNFDTSNVTDMNSMFSSMENLISLNVSNFDTSKVTNMNLMFFGMSGLTSLDVSNFDTSNVTDMNSMFSSMPNLTSLDLSKFNTSNVTKMAGMFTGMKSLESLDVSNFNTSKITDMSLMFYGMESLTSLDVSNFDTSKVTNMSWMFRKLGSLTTLNVSNFDTSSVTNMQSMFSDSSNLISLDVSRFNTSNVTDMWGMFFNQSSLTSLNVSNFDTSKVINMQAMFSGMTSLTTLDVSRFNTSNTTRMAYMFYEMKSLTSLDVSHFNTSNASNLCEMFYGMSALTSLDLSSFDTSNAVNMSNIFYNTPLKHIKLGEFFKFNLDAGDTALINPPSNEAYTGKWIKEHVGNSYTSFELAANYDGSSMSGDWYWEQADQTSLKANDSTLYVGDTWNPEDNFESATDKTGASLKFEDIKVIGTVDTNKAGVYPVSYVNGSIQSDVEVTVKDKQTAINVHDSSLYVGDTWKAEDNFDSALDKDGNKVDFSQLTVDDSKVDTTKAGVYNVTYTYDGLTSTAKVTVNDKTSNVLPSEDDKIKDKEITSEKKIENTDTNKTPSEDTISENRLPETGEAHLLSVTTTIFGLVILLISILFGRKQLKK